MAAPSIGDDEQDRAHERASDRVLASTRRAWDGSSPRAPSVWRLAGSATGQQGRAEPSELIPPGGEVRSIG
jgi:hypothetical protein